MVTMAWRVAIADHYSTQNFGKEQLNLKYYLKNLNSFTFITLL